MFKTFFSLVQMFSVVAFFALSIMVNSSSASDEDPNQQSIAIMSFEKKSTKLKGLFAAESYNASELSDAITQHLTEAFFQTKRFSILERSHIAKVFDEMKLQGTAEFNDESAVKLGKMLGANIIVVGTYTANMEKKDEGSKYKSDLELNIRLIDVQLGKIRDIIQAGARGSAKLQLDSVNELLNDFSKKLDREVANHYPQTGYVIKVLSPLEAVIDVGRKDGISEEDEFIFFKVTEDIVHPVTKKVLKGERTPLGSFTITSMSNETSIVKTAGSAEPLAVGSVVERKPRKPGIWESVSDLW